MSISATSASASAGGRKAARAALRASSRSSATSSGSSRQRTPWPMRSAPSRSIASQTDSGPAASPAVRHAVQAGVPGHLEGPGELRARHLGTIEPQADESGGPMAQHQLHGLDGKLGPTTAVDVGAPAQPHAVLGLDLGATLLDPLEQRLGCDAAPDMTDRGDRDLRVADVLGRQRRAKLPGDQGEVVPAPQVTADQQVDLEEVGEVTEAARPSARRR